MIDYSKGKIFHIEDIEYEIHILKIKFEYFPFISFSLLLFAPFNFFYGIFFSIVLILFSRYCFLLEEKGIPFEYNHKILKFAQKYYLSPFLINPPIIQARSIYRD